MLATLAAIWLVHVAALITPGANVLLVSQLAASDRTRSAAFAAFGVTAGAALWSVSAALGVNAVFEAFPGLRLSLQIAGALYLLYIATRLWRSQGPALGDESRSLSRAAAFRLGLLTNATNPKSALFFGSVFSAALPAQPSTRLLASAVAMVILNAFVWHLLLAYLFSRPRVRSAYSAQRRLLNRVAGALAAGLGLTLLAARCARRGLPGRRRHRAADVCMSRPQPNGPTPASSRVLCHPRFPVNHSMEGSAMTRLLSCAVFGLTLLSLGTPAAAQTSAYAGQEAREIKAMSPEDVGAYLSGKGMGLAKAAELNGYPGPAHVLELASRLELTPEQRTKTQSLFASMESKAMSLGRALVDEERKLDRLFASKAI
ncbi:partial Threonine efflux protein, partial [Gammaproteobacteria bacterium]